MSPPTASGASLVSPRPRRSRRSVLFGLAAAAAAIAATRLSTWSESFVGAGLRPAAVRADAAVALQAVPSRPAPAKFGRAHIRSYEGYIHRKRSIPRMTIRLDRRGYRHVPFYRILVQYAKKPVENSARFIEHVGFYDPMKKIEDPAFFKLKADRVMYWLRHGAQPTEPVANLLDRAGLIRRTGPLAKRGEWEYRVPKMSGPDAPEGWSYDGPHAVTWNNMPKNKKRSKSRSRALVRASPLIERFGFRGYAKIPLDHDAMTEPVDGSALSVHFPNTHLPSIDF